MICRKNRKITAYIWVFTKSDIPCSYASDIGLTSLQKYNSGTHEITPGFNLCPNNGKDIHCPVYSKTLKHK